MVMYQRKVCMKFPNLRYAMAGLVLASVTWIAQAALPEPLDPREVSSMTFEQRLAHGQMIREEMKKATPEERKVFRDKMHQKMQALSPQEHKELHQKMHAEWQSLSTEQSHDGNSHAPREKRVKRRATSGD